MVSVSRGLGGFFASLRAILTVSALVEFASPALFAAEGPAGFSTGGHGIYHLQPATVGAGGMRGIIAAAFDGTVLCYTSAGERLWSARPSPDFPYDLAVADLDGDGLDEALVATAGGGLHVLGRGGTERWTFRDPAPLFQVAVARDAGRRPVVLTGGVSQKLHALSGEGRLLHSLPTEHCIRHVRAGDIRGEGRDLVAVATASSGLSGVLSLLLVDPADLSEIWRRRDLGTHAFNSGKRFFSLAVTDLTGDGRAEMLLSNSWGEHGKIFAWDHTGKMLFEKSDKRIPSISYRMNLLTPVRLPDDRFVLGLFGNVLIIYNQDGTCREVLNGPYSCANAAFDPVTRTYYLGSSVSGGDGIYALHLDQPDWRRQFTELRPVGRLARIEANLARLQEQIAAFRPPSYQPPPRKITVVANPPAGKRDYEHLRFVRSVTWSQRHDERSELWCRHIDRRRPYNLTAEEIERNAAAFEAKKQDFLVWAGHGHAVYFSPETFRRVIQAAPNHLWGFQFAEMEGVGADMQEVVKRILLPLAELCRRHGKKILLLNKNIYWSGTCYLPFLRDVLLDPNYRDVFVPALEETNCRTQELSLAGRIGLWQSGRFDNWSCRMVTDNANWDRMWEWGGQQVPVHHLRHLVSRAGLGASVFINNVHQGPFTDAVYARLTPFYDLLEKGIVPVPRPDELLSLSDVAIGMRSPPSKDYLAHGINSHAYRFPKDAQPELVFDRLDAYWGGAPLAAHDASRYVYGAERRQTNFLPPSDFGLVPILPADTGAGPGRRFRRVLETDGQHWYDEAGVAHSASHYQATVRAVMAESAARLPLRVTGGVHWSAVRLDPTHVRVILIDSGYLDPAERHAHVRLQHLEGVAAVDILSGESLPLMNGGIEVEVPAGLFRVVDVTHRPMR